MKKVISLTILFVFIGIFSKAQNVISSTFNPIVKERPADYEYLSAPDSVGKRTSLKTAASILSSERTQSTTIKLPYPIIFIHGLNSNAGTWLPTTNFISSQYGLANGGRFDYCLNYDGSNATTNTNFYPTANADLAVFSGTWIAGDYYYVNFDVGSDGSYNPNGSSYDVTSNQQAIVKQGKALRDAIYRVLQLTGRDKVVLMGHSMGGLAAREYIQNSNNWQPDGKHHIAKLVTTGTPHGGSNQVTGGSILSGVDCQEEAYRDLRTTYSGSGDPGVYLFGGTESNSVMDLSFCSNFYNIDVNCNGAIGDNITGLDQKSIYTNLDYSCIIGECTGCSGTTPGDGVVLDYSADLNNYYSNITTNLFYYYASAVLQIHTDLPSQIIQNMQGLDEPDKYVLAYNIGFDTTYTGFTTVQATGDANYPVDFDLYKFTVPVQSNVSVSISNISLTNLSANIIDATYSVVGSTHSSGGSSSINFSQTLNAGDYYFSVYGTEAAANYVDPYSFILSQTVVGVELYEKLNDVLIYPNPNDGSFVIETQTTEKQNLRIYDVNGKIVLSQLINGNTKIDASGLSNGVYNISIISSEGALKNKRIVITH